MLDLHWTYLQIVALYDRFEWRAGDNGRRVMDQCCTVDNVKFSYKLPCFLKKKQNSLTN